MRIGNKTRVALVELGMLGGIVVALYTVPDTTPLRTFLTISGAVFLLGNTALFIKVQKKKFDESGPTGKVWSHIFRAWAIVIGAWLLIFLLARR